MKDTYKLVKNLYTMQAGDTLTNNEDGVWVWDKDVERPYKLNEEEMTDYINAKYFKE